MLLPGVSSEDWNELEGFGETSLRKMRIYFILIYVSIHNMHVCKSVQHMCGGACGAMQLGVT